MLDFSLARRTPVILQAEAAECGLACVAMVAGYHGHRIDLATLRARHAISLRGSTLADLMRLAGQLNSPRALCGSNSIIFRNSSCPVYCTGTSTISSSSPGCAATA